MTIISQAIFDAIEQPLLWKDLDGVYQGCNQAFTRLFQLNDKQIQNKTDRQLTWLTPYFSQMENQILITREKQICRECLQINGRQFSLIIEISPLKDSDDNMLGWLYRFQNSPDESESVSKFSDDKFGNLANIIANMPGHVYWQDLNGVYLGCNDKMARAANMTRSELIGRTDASLPWGQYADALLKHNALVIEQDRPITFEEKGNLADGSLAYFLSQRAPLRDNHGRVRGILGISFDTTKQKIIEQELIAQKDKAESANKAKSEFLATMSHELRTPLNAILGMAQILQTHIFDREQQKHINAIYQSGRHLLNLINDTLEFSKLEAGKLDLIPVPFDARQLLEELCYNFTPQAQQKNLEIIVDYSPAVPHILVGDTLRIRQILTNLVNNAIKFTERGHILIAVECGRIENGRAEIQFSVEDTGIGIPAEKLAVVFERFTQVDSSYGRSYEGSGLGLAISAQLVELMGGHIGVHSEPNKGSIFWCTINLPMQGKISRVKSWVDYHHDIPIVIVDDHKIRRRVLCKQLGSENCFAVDANEAFAVIKKNQKQIVLIEQELGELSPNQLAQTIRQDDRLQDTLLILLSNPILTHLNQHMINSGNFFFCLEKPIHPSEFANTLDQVWHSWHVTKPQKQPIAKRQAKILLVEDNVLNQKVAHYMLTSLGCLVDIAGDGETALQNLQQNYDLIFMDISLPGMSGIEITKRIRQQEKTTGTHVPIIALTAFVLDSDKQNFLEAGMDDLLAKPILQEKIPPLLKQWLPDDILIKD